MSGREFAESIAGGRLPPPPMASPLGIRVTSVGEGDVLVTCAADEAFYNPLGVVHGGLLCTLLDTAMGLALHTLLPPGAGFSTRRDTSRVTPGRLASC
jgi:acyl-coenzyme A thioesterase PaaI-like protein